MLNQQRGNLLIGSNPIATAIMIKFEKLIKGTPPREYRGQPCKVCNINLVDYRKNAWRVWGYEMQQDPPITKTLGGVTKTVLGRSHVLRGVRGWLCSKRCAEMFMLQNL